MYTLQAQSMLYGTICDEHKVPIAYASVCDAPSSGVVTNQQGLFSLTLCDLPHKIVVSAMGYETDTMYIASNNAIYTLKHKQYQLNDIVVSARQYIENKSAVSAYTTSKQEIKELRPRNINEVLQNNAGFTNNSGYQTPLTLRGMSGKRLLVLRNGTRRFSSYPAGFMSHTVNIYDLERIEIEKGAASVIYGAGAMAGVINLIDKSPFKQKGFNAKLTTGYGSVNNEKNILACGGWSNGKFASKVGFRYRTADNFTYHNSSSAENSFYTDKDVFITVGYKLDNNKNIVFTADFHNGGPWGKPIGFNGSDYMRVQTHDEISNNYALKYSATSSGLFTNTNINLYYSDEKRKLVKNYYTAAGNMLSYVETTRFSDHYYGFNINSLLKVNDRYSATIGTESYLFNISTPIDAVDYIEGISFTNRVSHNAHSLTSGIFAENKFNINPKLVSIWGLRFNYATVNEGDAYSELKEVKELTKQAFSGNFALKYRPNTNNLIKLNIARSFRMPQTTELFTDNYTSNGILYANPQLLPEYCNSFDICYRYKAKLLEVDVSPFVWLLNNMITKEEVMGMPGTNYTYVNIGKTRMYGGEINAALNFRKLLSSSDKLTFRAGLAYLNGTDVTTSADYWSQGTPLNYVPPVNIKTNLHYSFSINEKVSIYLMGRCTYYAEQTRLGEEAYATPAYILTGCNAGVSFLKHKLKPKLNIAVNNLLNTEYYPYLSYLPAEGRDVRFFLTLNI